MSKVYLSQRVGELVAENPARSRVFERFGIDYCCSGKRTLEEACSGAEVEITSVLNALDILNKSEQAERIQRNWTLSPLNELIAHVLEVHHGYLHKELPRLEKIISKVTQVHGGADSRLARVKEVFLGLKAELETHLAKEENILFPMVLELEASGIAPTFHCGTINNPIGVMEHEHDQAGEALREIRSLTDGFTPPPQACNTYLAMLDGLKHLEYDTHQHIHLENNILFPRAQAMEKDKGSVSFS